MSSADLPLWQAALVWAPALLTGAAAMLAWRGAGTSGAWRAAHMASLAALVAAAAGLIAVALGATGAGFGARADRVGALVLLLVAFVGWVIVRYSQTYLQGEQREAHYVRWLMATLAAVLVVVATDHLLVLALAWTATSLTLHRLLTFFGDRPAAVVAAHKKFIVARLADVCMLGATTLLWLAYGTPLIRKAQSGQRLRHHRTHIAGQRRQPPGQHRMTVVPGQAVVGRQLLAPGIPQPGR